MLNPLPQLAILQAASKYFKTLLPSRSSSYHFTVMTHSVYNESSCCCLFRSLVGQSSLLSDAHLLQPGLSLIRVSCVSLLCCMCDAHLLQPLHATVSYASRGSLAPAGPLSGLESLTLIALSSDPRSSPAQQQTAKHDELYPLLSVSLTVSFVERFQQRDDPYRVGFYASAFLFFLRVP